MTEPAGSGGGSLAGFFAVTPSGERIYPDEDGVLHCTIDDTVVQLGGGRAGV